MTYERPQLCFCIQSLLPVQPALMATDSESSCVSKCSLGQAQQCWNTARGQHTSIKMHGPSITLVISNRMAVAGELECLPNLSLGTWTWTQLPDNQVLSILNWRPVSTTTEIGDSKPRNRRFQAKVFAQIKCQLKPDNSIVLHLGSHWVDWPILFVIFCIWQSTSYQKTSMLINWSNLWSTNTSHLMINEFIAWKMIHSVKARIWFGECTKDHLKLISSARKVQKHPVINW